MLREYRKKCKLTGEEVVKELAKYNINVSSQTIYNYETNLRQPNADIFLCLCKIYNITSFDIFFDESTSKPNIDTEEQILISAYKSHPEMQQAINKMLDISNDATIPKPVKSPGSDVSDFDSAVDITPLVSKVKHQNQN